MALFDFLWLSKESIVCISHLLYPLICWWTCRLLPCLDYCKYCCSEHGDACIFFTYSFHLFWIYAQVAGLYGNSVFSFLRNLHIVLPSSCTKLHSPKCRRVPFLHTLSSIVPSDLNRCLHSLQNEYHFHSQRQLCSQHSKQVEFLETSLLHVLKHFSTCIAQ